MSFSSYASLLAEAEASQELLVRVRREGATATVVLDDPQRLNALSAVLTVQLRRALDELARDPEVRAVILTGEGRAFSAGGDLGLMEDVVAQLGSSDDVEGAFKPYQWIRYQFGALVRVIARSDKAFIAAVHGPAAGVGLSLALACDVVIASTEATLVPAFGRLGLVPEVGSSWALTRALGYRRAFGLYVSGDHLSADEAYRSGLVNEVVEVDVLEQRAQAWAERVCAMPRHALAIAKPLLRAASDASWEQSLTLEEFAEPTCFTTAGFAEGLQSVRHGT